MQSQNSSWDPIGAITFNEILPLMPSGYKANGYCAASFQHCLALLSKGDKPQVTTGLS